VETWASNNNLQLNRANSQEIVFSKPGKKLDLALLPPPLPRFTRVTSVKILGVTFANNFSVSAHVDSIILSCAQTLYALKTLRALRMSDSTLHTVLLRTLTYDSACSYLGVVCSQVRGRRRKTRRRSTLSLFSISQTHANLLLGSRQDRKERQELVTRTRQTI